MVMATLPAALIVILVILEFSTAATYTEWGNWSGCAATCQTGDVPVYRYRLRHCEEGLGSGPGCGEEDLVLKSQCVLPKCPVDGSWGPWSRWSRCSASCYGGSRFRTRLCNRPAPVYGGKYCEGHHEQTNFCNEKPCPVPGYLTNWTPWTSCPECVKDVSRERSRECVPPKHNGAPCPKGKVKQTEVCYYEVSRCPVDGGWSGWSEWSNCPLAPCDKRITQVYRIRRCDNPKPARQGRHCEGLKEESKNCTTFTSTCPVDGSYGPWSAWEPLPLGNRACQRSRSRECKGIKNGGKSCIEQGLGDANEIKGCDDDDSSGSGSGSGSGEDGESGSGRGDSD